MPGLLKLFAVGLSCAAIPACVSDPSVENDVPARSGAHQPGVTGQGTLPAVEACNQLVQAEQAGREKLRCKAPADKPLCPLHLAVAGALPCDSYEQSTVSACVAEIGQYAACDDFDTKPCIVTAVASSCHAPVAREAGPGGNPDAAPRADGGPPDAAPTADGGPGTGIESPDGGGSDATIADSGSGAG
jgi:hypothetical protein